MAVVLLHWKQEEIGALAARIKGYRVEQWVPVQGESMKGLAAYGIPDALVISLDRLPSHGRDVGYAIHMRKPMRQVPLVYVGGDPAKVAKIRELLPEAVFTSWDDVTAAIRKAIANPPAGAPKPGREFHENPLHQKIGLKSGMRIALIGAPAPLETLVPGIPKGIAIEEDPGPGVEMTLWFVRSEDEFEGELPAIAKALGKKPRLWIFYRKGEGLAWNRMLESAGRHGLGQFKVMRLDAHWAGVAFGRSRSL